MSIYQRRGIIQRPDSFTLNRAAPLAHGLVFAGLGNHKGSTRYEDSSPLKNHGTLSGYTGAGNTPGAQWEWNSYLQRYILGSNIGSSDDNVVPTGSFTEITAFSIPLNYTIAGWMRVSVLSYMDGSIWNIPSSPIWLSLGAATNGTPDWSTLRARFYSITAWGAENSFEIVEDGTVSVNTWVHLVGRVAGGVGSLWKNGVQQSVSDSFAVASASARTFLGRTYYNSKPINIADPCWWNRALSLSEISALADPSNVMLSGLILPPRRRIFAASVATGNRRRRVLCTC